MYIAPNTDIKILKNVPLDPTYEHTIWFDAESDQTDFFLSKVKYSLSAQSYQRLQRGYMRVNINAESLYDCNYIMYRNTSFGNKWFFAFLESVEYVNNVVSEIKFEIDVMQTWYFDYDLEKCFVEREHAYTDHIGDNIVEENLDLGEIINFPTSAFDSYFRNYVIVIAVSEQKGQGVWDPAEGEKLNGVYTGIKYIRCDGAAAANTVLNDYTKDNKTDAVVSVFMIPSDYSTEVPPDSPYENEISIDKFNVFTDSMDGGGGLFPYYTPRNKKLCTYPYNYLTIVNSDGESNTYRQEFFTSNDMVFKLQAVINTIPEYQVVPCEYKGDEGANYLEALRLSSSIQCAYAIDSYRAWIAQRRYPLALGYRMAAYSGIGGVGRAMIGGLTENPNAIRGGTTQMKTGLAGVLGIVSAIKQASTLPDSIRGSNSNVMAVSSGWYGFHAYHSQITVQYAKIIDDFFDRYGYATKRNKYPNTHVRQSWTYTKTIDCTITGSLPADDADKICSIYNSGITFWVNGNKVGDYGQNNSPLGGGD